MRGKILSVVRERGFGFIRDDAHGSDLFFHANSLRNRQFIELRVGEVVEFQATDAGRGPLAIDVWVI